jgi:hypothetical protein
MVFCFVQKFFFGHHELEYKFFLSRNFFKNSTLGYMTKTLNQIIFFFLHQNQNIFFSNIGNQNIFLEKNHNPPFKLNGRSLSTKRTSSSFLDIGEQLLTMPLLIHSRTSSSFLDIGEQLLILPLLIHSLALV